MIDNQTANEPVVLDSQVQQQAISDSTMHDLIKLLERPTIIDKFPHTGGTPLQFGYSLTDYETYSKIDDVPGAMRVYEFPTDIITINPIVKEKLNFFKYIKADIEIELKVNASPFVQGAFMLSYVPYANQVNRLSRVSNVTMQGMSTYPNVKLILGQVNNVKLVVPWINEYDAFDLTTQGDYFGSVVLSQIAQLKSGDDPKCAMTVMARFVNTEIKLPTGVTGYSSYVAELNELREELYRVHNILEKHGLDPFYAEGPEGESTGPVTKIANTIATVSETVSGIPVIGKVAQPISWLARTASNVASVFGWSKDTNCSNTQMVDRTPARGFTNLEGVDNSVTLGAIVDNRVDSSSALNSDKDDMSIERIVRHPNLIQKITWSTEPIFHRIGTIRVHPIPTTMTGLMHAQLGSFSYTATMAKYWRGSLEFTFHFVATKFHAGRIVVAYFPDIDQIAVPENIGNILSTNYCHIIDLTQINADDATSSEYTLTVPYVSNAPWKETVRADVEYFNVREKATNGWLGVYVLNDLLAPSTCSQNVDILVSCRAGPDFQLAVPQTVFPIGWLKKPSTFVAEGPDDRCETPEFVNPIVPNVQHNDLRIPCMGEYFDSLRAFTKRFAYSRPMLGFAQLMPGYMNYDGFSFKSTDGMNTALTPIQQVLNLFRFSAGGWRYKIFSGPNDQIRSRMTDDSFDMLGIEHVTQGTVNNCHEINVPFYNPLRLRSHSGIVPTVNDKRLVITRDIVTAFLYATPNIINTTEKTISPKDQFGFAASEPTQIMINGFGKGDTQDNDVYYYIKRNLPSGDLTEPLYEHNQWIKSHALLDKGDEIFFVNNGPGTISVRYSYAELPMACVDIYEAAADDFSASFMVAPNVIRTRDYQTA